MKSVISANLLKKLKPESKPYEVRDKQVKGFILRVQPSGVMSYVFAWGRGRRKTIGRVGGLKAEQARAEAKRMLGQASLGQEPTLRREGTLTLRTFLENEYDQWMAAHYPRSGAAQAGRVRRIFPEFLDLALGDITVWHIEKFRTQKLKDGRVARTVNRDVAALRACLRRAVDWGRIPVNPLARLKPIREDASPTVRYLSTDEEKRLLTALEGREEFLRRKRDNGNRWRRKRGYPEMPNLRAVAFSDHLRPMVLVAMHTGLRRGELFALRWDDVDLQDPKSAGLTVHGHAAKTGQSRHVPLNAVALRTLRLWRKQSGSGELVFPSASERPLDNVRKSWDAVLKNAEITGFRWHDIRHHFASRLVQRGVDLNTVRELLGHSDIKMTLRYAHLAPENRRLAVEKLAVADHQAASTAENVSGGHEIVREHSKD